MAWVYWRPTVCPGAIEPRLRCLLGNRRQCCDR